MAPAVTYRSALALPLGERTITALVRLWIRLGIERRETHEQDKNHGARKAEWHMEAKKAVMPVAAATAKRLIRKSGGWLHAQCFTENSLAEFRAATGDVRNDVAPGELASYCLHALAAASGLPSKAAVRRLVTVTLAGLHPGT